MKSSIIAIGIIAAASVASASFLPMFMKQEIEMSNMLLGKASQAQVQTSNEKHPLDFGPYVAKGTYTIVWTTPEVNSTAKYNIFEADDLKLSRRRSSMVFTRRPNVRGNAPHDFKSMLAFAQEFQNNDTSEPVGIFGHVSVSADGHWNDFTQYEDSYDLRCMEGNYTPQEVEFPPMEFLGYDFIGNTLVKKYLIPPIPNFNRRFTKFFGLNRATHSNTLSFIIVFDAFNGNLVGYYENDMGARGYLYYAFMLYDEFTRVDSILPFLQVPAELTANCTEEA